jgi:hypothetical protein
MQWKLGAKEFSKFIVQACNRTHVLHHTRQQDIVLESSDTAVIDTLSSKNVSISISGFKKQQGLGRVRRVSRSHIIIISIQDS